MDKPKRKRSDVAKPLHNKWRLGLLSLLYTSFFIPHLLNFRFLLYLLYLLSLAMGISWGSVYFVKSLGKTRANVLTNRGLLKIGAMLALIAWIFFTIPVFFSYMSFMDRSFYVYANDIETLTGLVSKVLILLLCFLFTFEIQFLIIDYLLPVPDAFANTKQKGNVMESHEPDIPLELLAESESTEQKMN
jgi:hypothetical protein